MSMPFPEKITIESVFVWLMHRISEKFADHAILKGGVSLRLVDCPRSTNDLDYVFVPYSSKKEILGGIEEVLAGIPNAKIDKVMSSKALTVTIEVGGISLQFEANVSRECRSTAMSTSALARRVNQLGRIIRIMSFDVALSHKLAAWNERRLLRDLYDVYFIYQIIGEKPDRDTLLSRLDRIEGSIPKLKKKKKMNLEEFLSELRDGIEGISEKALRDELSPLLDQDELVGLDKRLKVALNRLIDYISKEFIG